MSLLTSLCYQVVPLVEHLSEYKALEDDEGRRAAWAKYVKRQKVCCTKLLSFTCTHLLHRKKCAKQLQRMVLLLLAGNARSLTENTVMSANVTKTKKIKDATARRIAIEIEIETGKRTESTVIVIGSATEIATGIEITSEKVAVRGTIIATTSWMDTGPRAIMAGSEIRTMSGIRIARDIGPQGITGTMTANGKGTAAIETERVLGLSMVQGTAETGMNLPEERNGSEVRPYMMNQERSTRTDIPKNVLRRRVAFALSAFCFA